MKEELRTGPACRLSFDECKEKFLQVGKSFEYNDETNHCQEVRYDIGDSISSNADWKTCRATSKKQGKLLHKFQNI